MQIFEEGQSPASAKYVIELRYPQQSSELPLHIPSGWGQPTSSMSVPPSSLRSFLAGAKKTLRNAIINQDRINLVIGNESADLDSITSAIVLAYFRTSSATSNSSAARPTTITQFSQHYIPVLNIPRADINIRPELRALLPHANLDASLLITLDDLAVDSAAGLNLRGRKELQPKFTQLLLVDHNALVGPLADRGFGPRVVGCIDHHVDEGLVPPHTGEPRIIQVTGSCTSLVTRFCQPAWDALSNSASAAARASSGQSDASVGTDDDAVRKIWDAQIAKLAIASVLIDTYDLEDESVTTALDRKVVDYLESKILLAPTGVGAQWNRHKFFQEIDSAKRDLSSLTPGEILRKDYKSWHVSGKELGIASSIVTLSYIAKKAGGAAEFRNVMKEFTKARNLDIFVIMAHSEDDNKNEQRELLMWAVNPKYDAMVSEFEKEEGKRLGLEPWNEFKELDTEEEGHGTLKIWWQREVQYSRKVVSPWMRKILEKL